MWDVTDPARPSRINVIVGGLTGTHKNWWECDTGIAYLVSGQPGWRVPRMTKIYDLSDPTKPVFIRDFGLHGQQPGSTGKPPGDNGLHGPVSTGPKGNRVYFAYGYVQEGVVQIVDREKLLNGPKEPTEANLLYPQISRMDLPPNVGAHNVFPLLGMPIAEFAKEKDNGREMLAIVDEATGRDCATSARAMMWIADITTETRPFGVANWTVSEASGNYCGAAPDASERIHARELHADLLQARACSWRTSMPACAPSISAIPSTRRKSGTTSRPQPTKRRARRCAGGPALCQRESRPITSRWTIAAMSMLPIAPAPVCTSSSSQAPRAGLRIFSELERPDVGALQIVELCRERGDPALRFRLR